MLWSGRNHGFWVARTGIMKVAFSVIFYCTACLLDVQNMIRFILSESRWKRVFFPWCTPFLYIVIILEPWMMNLCLGSAPDNHQNCQPNLRQKSTLDWDELISNEKGSTQIISYKVQIFREGPQKFEKISSFVLTSLSNFKNRWEIFPNFVAFSQYLNFYNVLPKLIHINIPSFFIA